MARPSDPRAKLDLLRAAEEVFVERGLDCTKVEEITERAGRSKGSFYLHFASKEESFRHIVENMAAKLAAFFDRITSQYEVVPGEELDDALARWAACDLAIFEFVWQNRGVVRLLLEGGKSASFGHLIDEFAERSRLAVEVHLRTGIRSGLFRPDLDVEVVAVAISGAYDQAARHLVRRTEKPDLSSWIASLQALVFRGTAGPRLRDDVFKKLARPRLNPMESTGYLATSRTRSQLSNQKRSHGTRKSNRTRR
jgi:AcrR family transcriptional regulator